VSSPLFLRHENRQIFRHYLPESRVMLILWHCCTFCSQSSAAVAEPEDSTLFIPKFNIGHHPELDPSTSHFYRKISSNVIVYYYPVKTVLVQAHDTFACTTRFGLLRPSTDTQSLYNQPSFYLVHPPTLASVYTLGVRCSGILFM
jgi:hypothetical protein